MKLLFVSNYINHHQIPVSDALYELTGGDYAFIQCEPMEEERVKMGWDVNSLNKPYVRLYYEDKEACDKLILESECVIFGGYEDESVILPRLMANKFTIRYSERIYRDGRWKFVSPRGLKKKYNDHTRFRKSNVYLLCSGAFVKGDFNLIHAYKNKMFKYGYFPKTERYDNVHEVRDNNAMTELLWVSRFIELKHPEMIVELASKLKQAGLNAHITMIGTGELKEETVNAVSEKGLEGFVSFDGNKKPEEIREIMRGADIFLFTSDHREGWGAVVNEAMNAGCVTFVSHKVGSAPYLIKQGENGYIFKTKSVEDLYKKVLAVCKDNALARKLGTNAYESITTLWNAEVAAKRLIEFIDDPKHSVQKYKDGPVSKA